MGMTQPMQQPSWRLCLVQVRCNSSLRLCTAGIQLRPMRRQVSVRRQMQLQGRRQQRALGIGACGLRLQVEMAADQSSIVMQGAAELQHKIQCSPLTTTPRQRPATGGIEQIPLMHQHAIHPETHLLGPPAQHQPGTAGITVTPAIRPAQPLLKTQPLASPGPDQQAALGPVLPVRCSPAFVEKKPCLGGA